MTAANDAIHRQKIDDLRRQYEGDGYDVQTGPGAANLPFDLGTYSPDLIARKPDGSGGLVVEVRTIAGPTSIERFQHIAQAVKAHAGWRFVIVSVDDLSVASSDHQLASWDDLHDKLVQVAELMNLGMRDAAILVLWSTFEGAMRRLAVATSTPVERLPASKLMSQLYTLGYMSVSEFQLAKQYLKLRNQVAHGFRADEGNDLVESFASLLSKLFATWKDEPAVSQDLA